MLRSCADPGCSSLTLGRFCIEHEVRPGRRVLVAGPDPETRGYARAAALRAWPDAEVVTGGSGDDPIELALAHEPDVILLACTACDTDDVAAALVLEHGLPDVRVILFTEVRASLRDSLIVDDGIPAWSAR